MAGAFAGFDAFDGHEQVLFGHDADTGLRCIIAIHSTRLGQAIGGTRFRDYESESEAVTDVLRLSKAMTYKNACAGLDAGGGKAVIFGDPATTRTPELLHAYGRMIASLGGRYITACDVGTTPQDMSTIGQQTRWVTGTDLAEGGSGDSGIPTGLGIYLAVKAVAEVVFGDGSLRGRHIAVQGVGKVGGRLLRHLVDEGAKISVADVSPAALEPFADLPGVEVVAPDRILEVDADIVSPNALGGVLDRASIETIQAPIVCGGANNQLADPQAAVHLQDRGILYAPDYIVNAGGIINLFEELHPDGYDRQRALRRVRSIPTTLTQVIELARLEKITTDEAAGRFAERRINGGDAGTFWLA